MTHCSRKRPRSCEEDSCELMPISKRINDLHIRSGGISDADSSVVESGSDVQSQNQNTKCNANVCMTDLSKEPFNKEDNLHFTTYEPELSVSENPYYYHVNEVLFEAHIQRLQRVSKVLS